MAVIAYTQRNLTKNVWSIMYGGSNDFAMTGFNAVNISPDSAGIAFAVGDGTIVEATNTAFYANSEVNVANTGSILLSDTISSGEALYWTADSGKIIIPSGKQLLVAITSTAANADVEISMFGLEI